MLDVVADISVPYAVEIGESVAVLAFGFSWLLKGSELLTTALNERGIPVWQPKLGIGPVGEASVAAGDRLIGLRGSSQCRV